MSLAKIVADILLVLSLVFMRDALGQVTLTMPLLLKVHVSIAVSTVLAYLGALFVGTQLLRGRLSYRPAMRALDRFLVPARILTFLTSLLLEMQSVETVPLKDAIL